VFESEADFHENWQDRVTGEGDFVVIRNEGPKSAPGMPEMLKPTTAIVGKYGRAKIGLMTDGRFSGGSVGGAPIIGHVDEAMDGGLIGIIEDGDTIQIDPRNNSMGLMVAQDEIERRNQDFQTSYSALERIADSPEDLKFYGRNTNTARNGATMLFH